MRAYVLSNGLPLSVGSVCWLWLESTRKDMGSASDVAHMMLCQVSNRLTHLSLREQVTLLVSLVDGCVRRGMV